MNMIGQSVFELESGNKNVDRQTDIGHIILIGRLVKHNLPKNKQEESARERALCQLTECF